MTLDDLGRAVETFLEHVSETGARIIGTAGKIIKSQHEFLHLTRGSRNDGVTATTTDVAGALHRLDEAHQASIAAMYAIESYCRSVGIPVRPRAARASAVTSTPTLPSRAGDPGSPSGSPTLAHPSRRSELGWRRENESAAALAAHGYRVEQNPPARHNRKNPDYLVEGRYFDCYSPTTANLGRIRNSINKKVREEQADRIVLNLDGCPASQSDIREALRTWPVSGLREVLTVDRGRVSALFP